jgi:hypothetical protein
MPLPGSEWMVSPTGCGPVMRRMLAESRVSPHHPVRAIRCPVPSAFTSCAASGSPRPGEVAHAQEDEQSLAAIHRALEQGVNWIDTAGWAALAELRDQG